MFETDSLTNGWFVVDSLATVAVPTSTHFIEEWAVDFVHFGPVDLGQPISHLIFYNRSNLT
jgi:hypothetical protein